MMPSSQALADSMSSSLMPVLPTCTAVKHTVWPA